MKLQIAGSAVVLAGLLAFGSVPAQAQTITLPSAQDLLNIIGPVTSLQNVQWVLDEIATGTPISQIGAPISHEIKCVILANIGSPIPDFSTECGTTPPVTPGGPVGGSLTGTVTGGGGGGGGGGGNTLTGTVVSPDNTLTGTVTGGGGGGGSGGGGGGGGGGSNGAPVSSGSSGGGGAPVVPGEVLGADTEAPDVPDTGAGGGALQTALLLVLSLMVAVGGAMKFRKYEVSS